MTAYDRINGKKPVVAGIEFGERTLFRKHAGNMQQKIKSRLEHGVFVGIMKRSKELMVTTRSGSKFARIAKRFPFERRWGGSNLEFGQSAPWRKYKEDKDGDGEIPDKMSKEERDRADHPASPEETVGDSQGERVKFVDVSEKAPRDFYITY